MNKQITRLASAYDKFKQKNIQSLEYQASGRYYQFGQASAPGARPTVIVP